MTHSGPLVTFPLGMTNNRVHELDLLRFVAAFAVVLFHYAFRGYAADNLSVMPYPPLASVAKYGHFGVELFFMISGFVILMTAAHGSLRRFVVSRIIRLYPAFWVCCTLTFLITLAIGEPRHTATFVQYLINLTMLSGFVGVPSLDGAYWSLFVELRFYALVTIVLAFGKIHRAQALLSIWLLASVACEILSARKLGYVLITDYSAFFIAGATCFLIRAEGITVTKIAITAASWFLAVHQAVNALPAFEKHYNTEMDAGIVIGIISAMFFLMLSIALKRTEFMNRFRWQTVGAMTYPLYLLHQNIGYMIFNISYPAINEHILFWTVIAGVLATSYLVHAQIERRLSSWMKLSFDRLTSPAKTGGRCSK